MGKTSLLIQWVVVSFLCLGTSFAVTIDFAEDVGNGANGWDFDPNGAVWGIGTPASGRKEKHIILKNGQLDNVGESYSSCFAKMNRRFL